MVVVKVLRVTVLRVFLDLQHARVHDRQLGAVAGDLWRELHAVCGLLEQVVGALRSHLQIGEVLAVPHALLAVQIVFVVHFADPRNIVDGNGARVDTEVLTHRLG